MGLPHLDFRVPESGWFKAALDRFDRKLPLGRFQVGPLLSSTGSLSLPYKIAIVAVMALVACGTLVTFGTAGAETAASSSDTAALPGTDEASPQVQGQVLPPSQSLLTSADLLSTLNLTDYSPGETTVVDDSDDSDDESDNKNNNKKKSTKPAAKATPKPTTKATTAAPKPAPTTSKPTTAAPTTAAPTTAAPKPEPEPSPTPEKKCAQWLGKLCIKWESS